MGTGVVVSSSHIVSAAPSSSWGGLLTLCPCSSVRSLSWETVLHKLLQRESFPWGAVLQEQAAPAWVPCTVTSPASKPAPAWAPLSTGPQVLAGACSTTGFPQGYSLLRAPTCSGVGFSMGCRWISAPPWTSMGCRWTICLTRIFSTGCRRISALAPGAPSLHPSSLTLVSAELFHIISLLSPHCCPAAGFSPS